MNHAYKTFKKVSHSLLATLILPFASALSLSTQAVAEPIRWINEPVENVGYEIDLEAEASHCEIVVEEVVKYVQSKYGALSKSVSFELSPRASDQVLNMGVVALVAEQSFDSETEETIDEQGLIGAFAVDNTRTPYKDYDVVVNLESEWHRLNGQRGERDIKEFRFFVDLVQDGATKRLWLSKFIGRDRFPGVDHSENLVPFSASDIDANVFRHTELIPYGIGTIQFLRKNSGSPVFAALRSCGSDRDF